MILIDGLRHDYLNAIDSPFLHSLAELNIDGKVRETFAFELRPAFFAGLQPEDCDVANMFHYNPRESLFRDMDLSHGDRKQITLELRKIAAERGYSLVKHSGGPAEIPINLLKYFDFSEKYHTAEPAALGDHKTLFDYLRSNGNKWLWIAYPDGPGTTDGVLRLFKERFVPDVDFIYLHFSKLDWIGHQYGPHSEEQKKALNEIDEAVRQIYIILNRTFSDVRGLIFGDHGMVKIRKHIDIQSMLIKTDLELERDYLYFLDSTQARFWFFSERSKKIVEEVLQSIPDGKVLTDDDLKRLRFRFKHNKFGDQVFVVDYGVGIFPNFFQQKSPCNGLHGYLPEVAGNWAKFIVTGCNSAKHIDQPIEMVDLFPTVLQLLDYKNPGDIEPQSIFGKGDIPEKHNIYEISVVIPTYNRKNILQKCLTAIEQQSFPKEKFEVIVVNDGATDGTSDFLEEFKKSTVLNIKSYQQENSGPAAARNKGILNSHGDIILLVGDDMIMSADFIAKHVKFHRQWPQTGHACLGYIDWSSDIKVNPLMKYITSDGGQQFNWNYVLKQDPENIGYRSFWSSNLSFKKTFSLTHGLFNSMIFRHAMLEDAELGHRLDKAGLVLHFRKGCIVYHEHEITFEGFANRQRMVGWYSHNLAKLGIDVNYTRVESERLYSIEALEEIIKAVKEFENNCSENEYQILERLYGFGLYYAAHVGYMERKGELKKGVGGIVALQNNLWLTQKEIENLNLKMFKMNRLLAKKEKHIQEILTSKSWKIIAGLRRLLKPLKTMIN